MKTFREGDKDNCNYWTRKCKVPPRENRGAFGVSQPKIPGVCPSREVTRETQKAEITGFEAQEKE